MPPPAPWRCKEALANWVWAANGGDPPAVNAAIVAEVEAACEAVVVSTKVPSAAT